MFGFSKKGKGEFCELYRPVSFTSISGKILEPIIIVGMVSKKTKQGRHDYKEAAWLSQEKVMLE